MVDIEVQKVEHDWTTIPRGLTWLFVGQPKTRKTSEAAKWSDKGKDGVLIIDADQGADMVDGANVVEVTSLNPPERDVYNDEGQRQVKTVNGREVYVTEVVPPEERGVVHRTGPKIGEPKKVYSMAEVLTWLRQNWDNLEYDTIVIDTLDEVNNWIERIVTQEMGIDAMGQASWGADWGKAKRRNLDVILKLQKFLKRKGATLILIAHAKQTRTEDEKVQLSPELPRGLGSALTAKADVIGYVTVPKGTTEPYISFEAYDERLIGSRLRPLSQKRIQFSFKNIKQEIESYELIEEDS